MDMAISPEPAGANAIAGTQPEGVDHKEKSLEDVLIGNDESEGREHGHGHSHSQGYSQGHSHGRHERTLEEREEQNHFQRILKVFSSYEAAVLSTNRRRKEQFSRLPPAHRQLLPNYMANLMRIDDAAADNGRILDLIIASDGIFSNEDAEYLYDQRDAHGLKLLPNGLQGKAPQAPSITSEEMDKVGSTLKQMVRDWSSEGQIERDACYLPLLQALATEYGHLPDGERCKKRILIPGAGLGRLVYEVAKAGYSCQGNEFSYYMLLASSFILNRLEEPHQLTIYPFIHTLSNQESAADLLRPIRIPDILPSGPFHPEADFSMSAGDFLEVYGQNEEEVGEWDAVISCYFIDTAHNIIEYLHTIWNVLKPGGLWLNLGPLLWHFEGMRSEGSIEPTLEDVIHAIQGIGFVIEKREMVESRYASNPASMLQYAYRCAFWAARKPLKRKDTEE